MPVPNPSDDTRISVRTVSDVVVVAVAGELDMVGAQPLRSELAARIRSGPAGLVVDFERVEFCASPGLRVLAETAMAAAEAGVPFVVAGARPNVARALEMGRLIEVVLLADDVDQAVAWVPGLRAAGEHPGL
ncbi:hypothetical protein GCM10027258_41890 [Amycolatopsis stemonae]